MIETTTNTIWRIGTAGWLYKDWVGSFYPRQKSKKNNPEEKEDWLQYYSQYFNCVEVNSTYYTYLPPAVAGGWINKVEGNKNFVFTIKLHQNFTHKPFQQTGKNFFTNENIKAVKDILNVLAASDKLGGLLIQFPYSFIFNDISLRHIQNLNEIFESYNRFVEVRHGSWDNNEAFDFFKQLDISLCTIDQPMVGKIIHFKPVITNNRMYVRLHGRNLEAWKSSINSFGQKQNYQQQNERYNYLYSRGEITEIAFDIKIISEKAKEIFVILNNHPNGQAVVNAFDLIRLLENRINMKIPETISQSLFSGFLN